MKMKMKKMILWIAAAILCMVTGVQTANAQNAKALADPVYKAYFGLKDALASDNASAARSAANALGKQITAVPMQKLGNKHAAWMDALPQLKAGTAAISGTSDLKKQRTAFKGLSQSIYKVMKALGVSYPVYYQYCDMHKAGWLSSEKAIRNPYAGKQMPTCGTVKEVLK